MKAKIGSGLWSLAALHVAREEGGETAFNSFIIKGQHVPVAQKQQQQ